MKELSIEEKAKRYNEALERAKKLYEQGTITESLSYVFPELKESEDEKIRKELYDFCIKCSHGSTVVNSQDDFAAWATWLEQHGFQKPTDEDMKEALRTEYEKGRADAIVEMQKPAWSEEDECYMSECIGAIATKDGWSFEEKRKTKHWLKSLKERIKK